MPCFYGFDSHWHPNKKKFFYFSPPVKNGERKPGIVKEEKPLHV
jgi:hypothetical protein